MRLIHLLSLLLLTNGALAATNFDHIFMCKVVGFNKKEVQGQCDPSRPRATMKIPREWLADEDIRTDKRVKFTLDDKKFAQWLAMNKITPKGKTK